MACGFRGLGFKGFRGLLKIIPIVSSREHYMYPGPKSRCLVVRNQCFCLTGAVGSSFQHRRLLSNAQNSI